MQTMYLTYLLKEISDGDMALIFGRDVNMTVSDAKRLKSLEESYEND